MYISGLEKKKLNQVTVLLDNNDISFEVWDEETGDTFTLWIEDNDNIRMYLGGGYDDLTVMRNHKVQGAVLFTKEDYYQIVW